MAFGRYLSNTSWKASNITKNNKKITYNYVGGFVTSEVREGSLDTTLSYTYNDNQNIETFTYAGETEEYAYDYDGLLIKVLYRARNYDPDTGRWTSKDPKSFNGGDTDLYSYCMNDPVNHVDPTGYSWKLFEEYFHQVVEVFKSAKYAYAYAGGISQEIHRYLVLQMQQHY